MKDMDVIDFNDCLENYKAYGGMAGSKLGILYHDEDWILKFPKTTKGMKNVDIAYTTAPLSEYIGSQIYQLLGYDVHQTLLGMYDKKLVVACKDFTSPGIQLQEFREIRNYYDTELETILEEMITADEAKDKLRLEIIKVHFAKNPLLKKVDGITERFWDCAVIDGFINNNDRNSGNWGILRNQKGELSLAPIFDNGAAFSTKISDEKIMALLRDQERFINHAKTLVTAYSLQGKTLSFLKLLQLEDDDLHKAIVRVVPLIQQSWPSIIAMIQNIPNQSHGISIISDVRKEFFIKGMEVRLNTLLLPAYHALRKKP